MKNLDTKLRLALPWLLMLLLPLPLLVLKIVPFPHVTTKSFYFRLVAPILLAWGSVYIVSEFHRLKRHGRILASLTLFLGACYLASLVGHNFSYSFWSSLERTAGLVNLTLVSALFVLHLLVFESRHWRFWFYSQVVISWLVIGYDLPGFVMGFFKGEPSYLISTLGNRSYFASYVFCSLTSALVLLQSFRPSKNQQRFLNVSLFFFTLILLLTTNRGTVIALALGAGYYLVKGRQLSPLWRKMSWAAVGLVTFSGVLLLSGVIDQSTPYFGRLARNLGTQNTRFMMWEAALKSTAENPFFGTGYGTYEAAFDKFYPKLYPKNEEWVDNAHNIFFELLSTTGLVGLLTFVLFLWLVSQRLRKQHPLWMALFIAYIVKQCFLIDPLESQIVFFLIMAFFIQGNGEELGHDCKRPRWALGVLGSVCILSAFGVHHYVVKEWRVLLSYMENTGPSKSSLDEKLAGTRQVLMNESLYVHDLRIAYAHLLSQLKGDIRAKYRFKRSHFFIPIETKHKETLKYFAHGSKASTLFAQGYYYNGFLKEGLRLINISIRKSPDRAKNYLHRASIHLSSGNEILAYADYSKAYSLDPNYQQAKRLFAASAYRRGNLSVVKKLLGEDYKKILMIKE